MEILITGAKGFLGGRLCELAVDEGNIVYATDKDTLDITDASAVKKFFENHSPDVVINCAVISPAECEQHSDLAWRVNVEGVENILRHKGSARMVHFSSPAVFEGVTQLQNIQYLNDADFGFKEDAEVVAVSVYGKTKIASEKLLLKTDALVLRTSWLYTRARPFGLFNGDQYATNEIGRPTLIDDVWKVIKILLNENAKGLWHLCGPEIMSRYEQAKLNGLTVEATCLPQDSVRPLSLTKITQLLKNID